MRQLKITKSITNRESASLDKYLQEKEADMLMICEGAYGYNAYKLSWRAE